MMRDELFAAKEKGIPVIVSMGDYAASGGVYIATPADYIFADILRKKATRVVLAANKAEGRAGEAGLLTRIPWG